MKLLGGNIKVPCPWCFNRILSYLNFPLVLNPLPARFGPNKLSSRWTNILEWLENQAACVGPSGGQMGRLRHIKPFHEILMRLDRVVGERVHRITLEWTGHVTSLAHQTCYFVGVLNSIIQFFEKLVNFWLVKLVLSVSLLLSFSNSGG